jgi:hypothetical protein
MGSEVVTGARVVTDERLEDGRGAPQRGERSGEREPSSANFDSVFMMLRTSRYTENIGTTYISTRALADI